MNTNKTLSLLEASTYKLIAQSADQLIESHSDLVAALFCKSQLLANLKDRAAQVEITISRLGNESFSDYLTELNLIESRVRITQVSFDAIEKEINQKLLYPKFAAK